MIYCLTIGKKVVRITHRAIHRAVHRLRHHYHSSAVKIIAPAMVCASTGAGLGLWPASAPSPAAFGPGLPGAAVSPSLAPVPVDGGMFVASPPTAWMASIIPLQLSDFPAEVPSFSLNEVVPIAIESSITAPSQKSPESVPEPSSIVLLGAAIAFFALIRYLRERRSFTLTRVYLKT